MRNVFSAVIVVCVLFTGFVSTNAFAATTTYTDFAAWSHDITGTPAITSFDNFAVDTPITAPLDVGPFIVQSQGGRVVDVPPYENSDIVYGNGTPNLSIYVDGTQEVATLAYKTPINAWFGDFWAAGNSGSPLEVTLVSASGNTNLVVGGNGTDPNSFGFITDQKITQLIFHNAINDGFNLDNVAVPSAVPVPGAIWLFSSAIAGLAALRRRFI